MIIRFPLERARPDLKYPKGNSEVLKALYRAMAGGYDREAWDILRKKK